MYKQKVSGRSYPPPAVFLYEYSMQNICLELLKYIILYCELK